MENSRLISLLKTLTYKEIKRFEQFCSSPFFQKKKLPLELLQLLKKDHPKFANSDKAQLFSQLYPGQEYADQKIRRSMSELYKALQDFLVYSELENNHGYKNVVLLRILNNRNLDRLFLQQSDLTRKTLQEETLQDADFYYYTLLAEEELYTYHTSKEKRSNATNLESLINHIDYHFLYRKLKYSCEILNRQHIISGQYERIPLLEPIVSYLKQHPVDDQPALKIYLEILFMLQKPDDEKQYQLLRNLLFEHMHRFSPHEVKDMFLFAQNYCIRKVNKGQSSYLEELFRLYNALLQQEILGARTSFTQFDFMNITTLALRLGKIDWLMDFTDQYHVKLPHNLRHDVYHLNVAEVHFARKEYKQALRELQNVASKDIYFSNMHKTLLLKIYYELDEVETFLSLVESFRKFLSRNTLISESRKYSQTNLIKFTKILFDYKLAGNRDVAKVREEIEAVQAITSISWLRQKLDELENPIKSKR